MSGKSRKELLQDMLREMPEDKELHYMVGMEHASEGDDAGAVRCFEELIRIAPDYPPAYHQAGRALSRLGKLNEARFILQKGIPIAQKIGDFHAAGEMTDLLESLE